jgi:hypothetical protein
LNWFPGNWAAVVEPAATARDTNVAAHRARARSGATAIVPLCYLLAAALLTWRLWGDPASRLVAGNRNDADQAAWFMQYAATAVRHGRLPALVTTGLNAPSGVNLMWNTPLLLPDLVLAPVTWLAGPQVSLTILTTAGFAGSATALFCVLRRWDVSIAAAALAGAVYGFSPALLQSALGHYDLELAILPPLIISAGVRLAIGPSVAASQSADPPVPRPARWLARLPAWAPAGAWLGLLVGAQLFINEELALTTALAGVLVALVLAVSRPRTAMRRVMPTAAGLVIAVVVALVLAGSALWTQFRGPLIPHSAIYKPDVYVNDLTTFFTPQSALLFHSDASAAAAASYQGGAPEYLAYLGWPLIAALAVAAVASWRQLAGRAAAVTLVFLFVCSLGGHPLIAGQSYPAVDLPWHWILQVRIFGFALPDRVSILADGAAATLLAVGIDDARARLTAYREPSRRTARLVPAAVVAVAVLCCLPLLPRPLPATNTTPLPAGWSAVFARLNLRHGSKVLVLPIPSARETLAMRWSADSGEQSAMIGGYFIGLRAGQAQLGGLMRRTPKYLNYLWAESVPAGSPYRSAAATALVPWTGASRRSAPSSWPVVHAKRALGALAFWQPRAVVADATASSPLGEYLRKLLGRPTVRVDGLIGWRVTRPLADPASRPAIALPRDADRLMLRMPPCASASGRRQTNPSMTSTRSRLTARRPAGTASTSPITSCRIARARSRWTGTCWSAGRSSRRWLRRCPGCGWLRWSPASPTGTPRC